MYHVHDIQSEHTTGRTIFVEGVWQNMYGPFDLRVRRFADAVELYYPVSAAGYGALVGLVFLGMVYSVAGFSPALHTIWLVILDLTIIAVAGNAVRLVWLSTVRFDFARDRVRRGLQTVGRISDIQAVAPSPEERASLHVLFLDQERRLTRWPIPGVRARDAVELGKLLADALSVPFHGAALEGR